MYSWSEFSIPGRRNVKHGHALSALAHRPVSWRRSGWTGAAAKGFDRGWFLDDEKIAYPMLEKARKTGLKRFCVHKGLPLGPVADYDHPRDLIKAAKDFPDIDFLVYHAGLQSVAGAKSTGDIPWTTEFCQMAKNAGSKNAPVADRGVPVLRDPRRADREAQVRAAHRAVKEQIFGLNATRVFAVDVNEDVRQKSRFAGVRPHRILSNLAVA